MPIVIRKIDHHRNELDAVAFGAIHYAQVERHLLEERTIRGLAYKEYIDACDAGLAFALSPQEIRQIVRLIRSLGETNKLGPTAVLVSNDMAFGVMRAMEMLLDDVTPIRPFREERLVRSWLSSQPNGQ